MAKHELAPLSPKGVYFWKPMIFIIFPFEMGFIFKGKILLLPSLLRLLLKERICSMGANSFF